MPRKILFHRVHTATPRSVRQVNRAIVLRAIRLQQPISCTALAKHTGIHFSNVSTIVDGLIGDGLVQQERATPNGRGRIPYLLSLNEDGVQGLAIDIRHSETRVALGSLAGNIKTNLAFPTPQDPRLFIGKLLRVTGQMLNASSPSSPKRIQRVGVSVPGTVRSSTGDIMWVPSLPRFSGFPLRARLERRFGVPVAVENNANLGALAEMRLAEHEGDALDNYVFLMIGEVGVGAGIIMHGDLYRGHDTTFAGEFGHFIIDPSGPRCQCGRRGCWQSYICDRATWFRYQPKTRFDPSKFRVLLARARQGDSRAIQALEETARYLSLGLSNIIFAFNPKVITVAGQITKVWSLVKPQLQIQTTFHASSPSPTRIQRSRQPLDVLFLRGALYLAFESLFAKPKLG